MTERKAFVDNAPVERSNERSIHPEPRAESFIMNLEVRTEGVQITETLREHVERKLRFALGSFGDRIRSVRIRLKDVNGPRGGEDILCNLE
ncbi:MAG: hypothetical protein AAF368_12650, partial [Planctomycetota bacterium]